MPIKRMVIAFEKRRQHFKICLAHINLWALAGISDQQAEIYLVVVCNPVLIQFINQL